MTQTVWMPATVAGPTPRTRSRSKQEVKGPLAFRSATMASALDGPIPARRWPAVTLHDPEILERVNRHAEEDGLLEWKWPSNILM